MSSMSSEKKIVNLKKLISIVESSREFSVLTIEMTQKIRTLANKNQKYNSSSMNVIIISYNAIKWRAVIKEEMSLSIERNDRCCSFTLLSFEKTNKVQEGYQN